MLMYIYCIDLQYDIYTFTLIANLIKLHNDVYCAVYRYSMRGID